MPRIITIAREYGSGGRLIAQRVAEKLGIFYYDNEIIDLAARELDLMLIQFVKFLKKNHQVLCILFLRLLLPYH